MPKFNKPFNRSSKPAGRPVGRNSRPRGGFDDKYASGFVRRGNEGSAGFSKSQDRGGKLELFDVTCESCGKATQVPFKPTGGKPVYCRDCFNAGPKTERSGDRPARRGSDRGPDELAEINRKLDRIMRALKIE